LYGLNCYAQTKKAPALPGVSGRGRRFCFEKGPFMVTRLLGQSSPKHLVEADSVGQLLALQVDFCGLGRKE